jgi:hypothetical protein
MSGAGSSSSRRMSAHVVCGAGGFDAVDIARLSSLSASRARAVNVNTTDVKHSTQPIKTKRGAKNYQLLNVS